MMVPAKPPIRNLRPLKSSVDLISLRNQPLASAEQQPRDMLPRVEPERQTRAECKRRIFSPVIIQRRIAHLDRAVRNRVEHLQAGNQFTGGKRLDLKAIVGDFSNAFAKEFAATVKRIEGLRPTGGQAPLYLGHRLRDRGRSNCARSETDASHFQKFTTFHALPPPFFCADTSTRATTNLMPLCVNPDRRQDD